MNHSIYEYFMLLSGNRNAVIGIVCAKLLCVFCRSRGLLGLGGLIYIKGGFTVVDHVILVHMILCFLFHVLTSESFYSYSVIVIL